MLEACNTISHFIINFQIVSEVLAYANPCALCYLSVLSVARAELSEAGTTNIVITSLRYYLPATSLGNPSTKWDPAIVDEALQKTLTKSVKIVLLWSWQETTEVPEHYPENRIQASGLCKSHELYHQGTELRVRDRKAHTS